MSERIAESRCEQYTRRQLEMLEWVLKRTSAGGDVAEKQELRNHPQLKLLMEHDIPEFVLFVDNVPRVVIECKGEKENIEIACKEAREYAAQLKLNIAIGVAGNDDHGVIVRNFYRSNGKFEIVTHQGTPSRKY